MPEKLTKLDKIVQFVTPHTTPQFQNYVKKVALEVFAEIKKTNPKLAEEIQKFDNRS